MSETIHIVAIISPKSGKLDRVKELLQNTVDQVKEKEPNTLRYHAHQTVGKGPPKIVMVETYANKAAIAEHGKAPYFQEFMNTLQTEDLQEEPTKILQCTDLMGFESRKSSKI